MSRCFSQGITDASSPAIASPARPRSHGPELLATRPDAGTDEQRIARGDLDAGLLLPGFEVLDVDRRARLQIRHALEPRNVDQDPAREDAVLDIEDRILRVAVLSLDRSASGCSRCRTRRRS